MERARVILRQQSGNRDSHHAGLVARGHNCGYRGPFTRVPCRTGKRGPDSPEPSTAKHERGPDDKRSRSYCGGEEYEYMQDQCGDLTGGKVHRTMKQSARDGR